MILLDLSRIRVRYVQQRKECWRYEATMEGDPRNSRAWGSTEAQAVERLRECFGVQAILAGPR